MSLTSGPAEPELTPENGKRGLPHARRQLWRGLLRSLSVFSRPSFVRLATLVLEYLAFPLVIYALLLVLQLTEVITLHNTSQMSTTITTYGLGTLLSLFTSGNLETIREEARRLLRVTLLIVLLLGIPFTLLALLLPTTSSVQPPQIMLFISIAYFFVAGLLYVIVRWPRGPILVPVAKREPHAFIEEPPHQEEQPSVN